MQNQNKFVGNSVSFAPPPSLELNFCHCSAFFRVLAIEYLRNTIRKFRSDTVEVETD